MLSKSTNKILVECSCLFLNAIGDLRAAIFFVMRDLFSASVDTNQYNAILEFLDILSCFVLHRLTKFAVLPNGGILGPTRYSDEYKTNKEDD